MGQIWSIDNTWMICSILKTQNLKQYVLFLKTQLHYISIIKLCLDVISVMKWKTLLLKLNATHGELILWVSTSRTAVILC